MCNITYIANSSSLLCHHSDESPLEFEVISLHKSIFCTPRPEFLDFESPAPEILNLSTTTTVSAQTE